MAFQAHATQSQRVAPAAELREVSASAPSLAGRSLASSQPHNPTSPDGRTWVLFPPPASSEAQTTSSFLTINDSANTTSDLGTNAFRSDVLSRSTDNNAAAVDQQVEEDDDEEDDDEYDEDAELDILDSHLADFRTVPNITSPVSTTVLPTHDGLGSFRLLDFAANQQMQEQLYAFEQFNPNHIQHSREGLENIRAELQIDPEELEAAERRARIEAWRLEHSRVLLEEIQKETRRQRRISAASSSWAKKPTVAGSVQSETIEEESELSPQTEESEKMEWHDDSADDRAVDKEAEERPKGFLDRITHKVIRDMLDLSDHDLAIIFGETYVDEDDAQATPRATSPVGNKSTSDPKTTPKEDSWQLRVIEGVARELGIFVNSVSPHPHPGAFSTYKRVQQDPIPYAGLEAIPEASTPSTPKPMCLLESLSQSALQFKPSFAMLQGAVPSSKPDEEQSKATEPKNPDSLPRFTQEEWEKDLDIKLVFKYLRSRFVSGSSSPAPSVISTPIVNTGTLWTPNSQESAAKAARIRQQHPLIGGRVSADRRSFKATVPASPAGIRHGSVCSQSTRRSARRTSASSRHYWDIGGSIGTGSVIAAATSGPMGSWGEV